jgi:endonuclease/exonuclease/phosphatase family metal-dependent hydrolase
MLFDSGLAIFSKHPISRSYHLIFKKQSIWDYLFVSRAALYAQIDLGKGKNLHVFTLHTAPSLDDMKKRTQLASLLEEKVPTVRQQGDELGEFMTKLLDSSNYNAKTDKIVCMGDFNVKAGTLDYFHFANIFSTKYQMVDITKKGGKDTDTWEPTFGLVDDDGFPLERLLTSPGLRGIPQTLDFIFTDAEKAGESSVLKLQCDDAKETRFQCVSDHAAVECKIKA